MGHVVHNADGEMPTGSFPVELVEDRLYHCRRELLRGEAIATSDDPRLVSQCGNTLGPCLAQRSHHIQVKRISKSARLLGSVEHGKAASAPWQCRQERGEREG